MNLSFLESLSNEVDSVSASRNVDVNMRPFKSTGDPLVDLTFSIPRYRNGEYKSEFEAKFTEAMNQDLSRSIRWLFYVRDIRHGLGERSLFRLGFDIFANKYGADVAGLLVPEIPEYGRWDDVVQLLDGPLKEYALFAICSQFHKDLASMAEGKGISLLAKWMPTTGGGRTKDNQRACMIAHQCGIKISVYRKRVTTMRRRIGVVEQQMTANKWDEIDYDSIPSRANLKYSLAFMMHDPVRRTNYLWNADRRMNHINAKTIYPYEIINMIRSGSHTMDMVSSLWKELQINQQISQWDRSILAVIDKSALNPTPIPNRNSKSIKKMDAALGAALYCAEGLPGVYKDKVLVYSTDDPKLVDLSRYDNVVSKFNHLYNIARRGLIKSSFDLKQLLTLILNAAIHNHNVVNRVPHTVLIISDMDFDTMTQNELGEFETTIHYMKRVYRHHHNIPFPALVFWNIGSGDRLPMMQNEDQYHLISGFSPALFESVTKYCLDPMDDLRDHILHQRYDKIGNHFSA